MKHDQPRHCRHRQGFLLFELLVAMAFLAVATGVALKMHQARFDYDRGAMDRLRQQLMIENLGEQLANVPYSEIPEAASELQSKSEAEIVINPFEFESKRGLHLIFGSSENGRSLTHHLWRLEPKP